MGTAIIPHMKKQLDQSLDEPQTEEDRQATFDRQQKIMAMFSDNAKTYIQLSGAALALTLTFAHEILHIPKDQNIANGWMIGMWSLFSRYDYCGSFLINIWLLKLLEKRDRLAGLRGVGLVTAGYRLRRYAGRFLWWHNPLHDIRHRGAQTFIVTIHAADSVRLCGSCANMLDNLSGANPRYG